MDRAHVPVVAASTERFSPALAAALHARGARTLVHTADQAADVDRLTHEGADGFYTDFYSPPPRRPSGAARSHPPGNGGRPRHGGRRLRGE